jgi:prepilin-type N-terminal cleavage/methylation domain-containing protein
MPPLHHRTPEQGFTLLEMVLVLAIVTIILSIAVPQALAAKAHANEGAAVATLRSIAAAQSVVHGAAQIDSDGDGKGEYGFLTELVAATPARSDADGDGLSDGPGDRLVQPSPAPGLRSRCNATGQLQQSGYLFQLILPGQDLQFIREHIDPDGNVALDRVHADAAEAYWCCYAWPVDYGATGRRAFFIDQSGEILACRNNETRYGGLLRVPASSAARYPGAGVPSMGDRPASGVIGADGNRWLTVR